MNFIEILNSLTNIQALTVFLISMAPVGECRISIIYGMGLTDLSISAILILSIIGNVLAGVLIIYILPLILPFIFKIKFIKKAYLYISNRTFSKSDIIQQRKYYGLMLFVSLPLPVTGVWTGALASNLLGLSKRKSILAITLGVCVSSTIVASLCYLGLLTIKSIGY